MNTHVIKIDKRIANTRRELYNSFEKNLLVKKYSDITIQDILNDCNISRSTFYSHFKTKEDLLRSISDDIFHHVFSHSIEEEKNHDFSKSSIFDYKHLITHIFYHIHDDHEIIEAILKNECKDIFINEMKEELKDFATAIVSNHFVRDKNIPDSLKVRAILDSFVNVFEYWVNNNYKETPELLTEYFISLNN